MNFNVEIATDAAADLKRLTKKHRSFKKDFDDLLSSLEENPAQGEPLGKDCFKVRLAVSSKQRGKSGGARVITCVKITDERVVIISVYDKSEADTIKNKDIERRLRNAGL